MDNKTKQAMQMALEALEKMAHPCNEKRVFDLACEVIPALREALAQPQGEWVDLTDDEILNGLLKWRRGEYELQIAYAAIAMFKKKNTLFRLQQQSETIVRDLRSEQPPVVPQGEPKCVVCGTTENLHKDNWHGYRCDSEQCICY